MEANSTSVSRFALLVGIDAYPEPHKKLGGAVRDVSMMTEFLKSRDASIHVYQLTAGSLSDSTTRSPTIGHSRTLPTYDNVIHTSSNVLQDADPGSLVYFHFSGHGTAKTQFIDEASEETIKPLALVLLSGDQQPKPPIRYLWGKELAGILQRMAQKKIHVTLVLDCCFSGSIMRNDCLVRFLPYDTKVDEAYPPDADLCILSADDVVPSPYRKGSMLPRWLAHPGDCSIITACGPNESAKELIDKGTKLRHGALSYYLLRAIKKVNLLDARLGVIYQHVQAMFREDERRQIPTLLGNQEYGILGLRPEDRNEPLIATVKRVDQGVLLLVGKAQGVCIGDQYELWPLDNAGDSTVAEVSHVSCLRSTLVPADDFVPFRICTGWMAKPLRRLAARAYKVKIAATDPKLVALRTILTESGFEVSDEDEQPCSLQIITNSSNTFEILDASQQPIPYLSTPPTAAATTKQACDMIKHLLWYEWLRSHSNDAPSDTFRNSYSIHVCKGSETFRSGPPWIEMKDGESIDFIVENKGDRDLYLYIYGMGTFWDVYCPYKKSHSVIPPKTLRKRRLNMSVTDGVGGKELTQSDDIFKVFLTSHWTSFKLLELPELRKPGDEKTDKVFESPNGSKSRSPWTEAWDVLDFYVRTHR